MIPLNLTKLNRWVCCSRDSKIPMKANEFKAAASNDPSTWASYEEALESVTSGKYAYLGFVFTEEDGYVGIDIDTGMNELGMINSETLKVIRECKSYTEYSKSKRGVHIILKGKLPFNGKNNRKGMEIYKTGRYFIMTGNTIAYTNIIENQEAIDKIVKEYFTDDVLEVKGTRSSAFFRYAVESPTKDKISFKLLYPQEIGVGCRNDSLASLAGQLHAVGYSAEKIYQELLRCNEICCKPPLDDSEVYQIVCSITRYDR